jgi:adenylate kinase family enzyme
MTCLPGPARLSAETTVSLVTMSSPIGPAYDQFVPNQSRTLTTVVLLSGHVAAGKTTLAEELERHYGFRRLSTRSTILSLLPQTMPTRLSLQLAGDQLDRVTGGDWVATALTTDLAQSSPRRVVVDSVRTPSQVAHIRQQVLGRVVHVHLTAPRKVLAERYSTMVTGTASPDYMAVLSNETERTTDRLKSIADLAIDSGSLSVARSAAKVGAVLEP